MLVMASRRVSADKVRAAMEIAGQLLQAGITDPDQIGAVIDAAKFAEYRLDPERYIREKLRWTPWSGTAEQPGQIEVLEAIRLAIRQQLEKRDFELGRLSEDQ